MQCQRCWITVYCLYSAAFKLLDHSVLSLQRRLQTVDEAGLPIWITELDIESVTDPTRLADSYDDIMTLYFSHPTIDGIMLWGFSDQHHSKPDAALFEGPEYLVR